MPDDGLIRSVKRFDGKNYQSWKFQITAVLMASEIFDVVDGTRTRPSDAEGINAGRMKIWIKDNAKATAIIASAMEDEQVVSVLVCASAKEMWDKLATMHEQKSASNVGALTQRFYSYKMSPSDTVIQHVSTIQNMARQLKDLGEVVSDAAVIAKILSSLTTRFSVFKTAWDSVDPARQTIENLLERLIREDSNLGEDGSSASALVVTKKGASKSGSSSKDKDRKQKRSKEHIECFRCQEKGHYASQCEKPKKQKARESSQKGNSSGNCAFIVDSHERVGRSSIKESPMEPPSVGQFQKLSEADRKEVWNTDSGASEYITSRRDWMENLQSVTGETVTLGDDGECEVTGIGKIRIEKLVNGKWESGIIENVLLVPRVARNLFSVGACTKKGFRVNFGDDIVEVSRNGIVEATGARQENGLYRMFFRRPKTKREVNVSSLDIKIWHERLGHLHKRAITELVTQDRVNGILMKDTGEFFCEPCQFGKLHKLPFQKNCGRVSDVPGEYIHSDVCGPVPTESTGGARYYVLFKDDATSFRYVYFMRHKSDVYERFMEFERAIFNKFRRTMKTLRTDNGTEYCNARMKVYMRERGIALETTAPYTPEQNGRTERDNRTIVEAARTTLKAKDLPAHLWAEATAAAVYTINRTGKSRVDESRTPYEELTKKKPDLRHMRVFGSDAYAHVLKQTITKFDARAEKLVLVGYDSVTSNYPLYDPVTRCVSISRHVIFNEKTHGGVSETADSEVEFTLPSWSDDDGKAEERENNNGNGTVAGNAGAGDAAAVNARTVRACREDGENEQGDAGNEEEENELRQQRITDTSRKLRNRESIRPPTRYALCLAEYNVPATHQEAISGPQAAEWAEAIHDELEAHRTDGTWEIVLRVLGEKTIDSKWVFKILRDTDGNVSKFKARLCARGFKQREGIDYLETFSPVVRYDSLRVLLAIITQNDLKAVQFDVRTAFLHGVLDEDIRMEPPTGLEISKEAGDEKSVVCFLKKSLYGLKQAPRCWNLKFTRFLKQFNLKETDADRCIFHGIYEGHEVYLALFVDDGVIASKSAKVFESIVCAVLSETFKITRGDCSNFVGVQICRDRKLKTMFIHQTTYARKVIERFGMSHAKGMSIPADPHTILCPVESKENQKENVPFREAVGFLMFLAVVTRPDIAYSVNAVSKFLNNHNQSHWQAVKRIMSYLVETIDVGIEYQASESKIELVGFSDADFASDVETRRSTTGYAFCLANGIVTWSSQRQKLVSLSTTESEYIAASTATREAVWLRTLLNGIGFRCEKPTTLYVDNQSAIRLARNPEFHKRTKHIDIKYHYISEKSESNEIDVVYVSTEAQLADIFTKALPRNRFIGLRTNLGIVIKRSDGGSVETVRRI